MNFLVTGGAGFIGSHVVEHLLQLGHAVTVVDDFNDFYDPAIKRANLQKVGDRVTVYSGDICDAAVLARVFDQQKFDGLIHLAARAGVRPSLQQPLLYTQVNVVGTQILLEAARRHGVPKVIFASSSSVYGVNEKVPFSEADPICQPISPYAVTKLAGEALCHVYHHLYQMDIVCLRFFTVYGPRQRPDLAIHQFTRKIAAGQPIELYGDGHSRRDYTYIDDIVQGVLACLDRTFGFAVINLGESQTIPLRRLVDLIEQSLQKKAVINWQPAQPGDVPVTYADISKARALLGYAPQVQIEQGIQKFTEWFQRRDR